MEYPANLNQPNCVGVEVSLTGMAECHVSVRIVVAGEGSVQAAFTGGENWPQSAGYSGSEAGGHSILQEEQRSGDYKPVPQQG